MEEKKNEGLSFSEAVEVMRSGREVARAVWGTSSFVLLKAPNEVGLSEPVIVQRLPDASYAVWMPRHADLLAADWRVM